LVYNFEISRWSHIVFGRTTGLLLLTLFIYLLFSKSFQILKERNKGFLYNILFSLVL
jgi:hypothetical protein